MTETTAVEALAAGNAHPFVLAAARMVAGGATVKAAARKWGLTAVEADLLPDLAAAV